jgi:hypothetical protein
METSIIKYNPDGKEASSRIHEIVVKAVDELGEVIFDVVAPDKSICSNLSLEAARQVRDSLDAAIKHIKSKPVVVERYGFKFIMPVGWDKNPESTTVATLLQDCTRVEDNRG